MADSNDIAIVGMALRVPGAKTPEQFWDNLRHGREALQEYPEDQLRARGVAAAAIASGDYVRAGMPLADFDQFDAEFFGFSPKEAAILDPQHRQFYEVAWEALERAGCVPDGFDGAIGIYAGCGMNGYFAHNILRNSDLLRTVGLFLLRHTGNDKDFLATRVSYAFDLKGPSVNVQTACSTSLVATHLAVQSLLAREVDVALAGGVTIEVPHGLGYLYQEGEILSPDGHCRAFDKSSKGTVFGSGVGVVVLKRLDDALRDRDRIHAVIKGSAVNNDGAAKVGYLAPSVEGQAAAISEAIALSGIDSAGIGYVECHGTGTPIGDPIEIAALTQAFRASSDAVGHCLVGSVKTNIGHLDTAAGVAGLIKAALALEHEAIPPSLHFEENNPAIAFDGSPFAVASRLTPWPRTARPRRAAVNSLGVGGTNAFVVIEEAPVQAVAADRPVELLALSARSRKSLDDYSTRLAEWLRAHPQTSLTSLAASLGRGRKGFDNRRVLAVSSIAEAIQLLEHSEPNRVFTHAREVQNPSIVFMFPGGGAQYPGMGRSLYHAEPVFRRQMDRGLELLATRYGADLRGVFLDDAVDDPRLVESLGRPSVQLPLVFLIEQALVALWESQGIRPAALIGHSMGENAAACAAGVFSLEEGLGLVLLRGQLMDEVPDGGMLSVPMAESELRGLLGPDLDLAAANGPLLSIASGPNAALAELAERLKGRGIEARRVRINIAAHSRMLDGILERFRACLRGMRLRAPSVPIVSNLTGRWLTDAEATDPEYWVRHLRNTVLFSDGAKLLLEAPERVFIEVGPGTILGSFVRQSHDAPVQRVVGSLRHPDDPVADEVYFRTVLGRLWAMGTPLAPDRLWDAGATLVSLPTYAFQHARYWIEPTSPDSIGADDEALLPERLADPAEWLTGVRWVQHGILDPTNGEPLTWCVFHENDPLLLACIVALREQGHRVVEVIAGDSWARVGAEQYTLAPESGGRAYQALLDALVETDRMPDRVLHGWLLTRKETFRPGKSFLHRNQEYGFYSLFYLARAFSRRAEGKRSHWTVVSNGAVSVSGVAVRHPDKATVLGACAVIPRELPGVTCSYVDVALGPLPTEPGDSAAAQAENRVQWGLLEELRAPPSNAVIAWRDRVRWMRHFAPHRAKASGRKVQPRDRGVYLITGGFGGIAGAVSEWLARDHHARLVLLARTPLPPREEWDRWLREHERDEAIAQSIQRVRDLEAFGAEVLPVAADVTVAEQLEDALALVKERFGAINGVFHAAGVLRDNLIALKSERDIEDVFSAKLYGTLVLDAALQSMPLDFMVLFSSVSSYVAPVGQIDYVAANAFLNAFAESCRDRRKYPVLAINWGIWKGIGMVATPHSTHAGQDRATIEIGMSAEAKVAYPLFDHHYIASDGTAQVHWITGRIDAARDWIANEHRLMRGDALVPATGFIELIRAALVEVGEGEGTWRLSALTFLQPFYAPDGGSRPWRIRLHGNPGRWRVELFIGFGAESTSHWEAVGTCRVNAAAVDAPRVDLAALARRCSHRIESASGEASLRTRQEAHLHFGPRWRVLYDLRFGEGEALAQLRLPIALRDDLVVFHTHPGLLDIATGCAMDLIPGYREQETPENLWVPLGYAGYHQLRPLPAEFASHVRLSADSSLASGFATFDVTLIDHDGSVLAQIDQLQLRRIDGELPRPRREFETPVTTATERSRAHGPAERALAHNLTRGISEAEGVAVLQRALAHVDRAVLIASPFRPRDLVRQADAVARVAQSSDDARFARPQLDNVFEAPRDEIERSLAELWGRLLGVEGVGIRDSFFDLGGHSLVAVRLFNDISDQYGVELPMSVLLQSPDIASLAERVRGGPVGETKPERSRDDADPLASDYEYIVPMHSGTVGAGTPLFIVAGMFGNVLNLSHLAHLLGEDRPFFALQARGLYGDKQPHESFEAMAEAYLQEVRRVQPQGPYLLGGFSGGGLIAFEMARQLRTAGERVDALILLDTPIRENNDLSLLNKVEMMLPGLKREGIRYVASKLRERREWKRELQARDEARAAEQGDAARFHSQRVGDAFLRALAAYRVPEVDVQATLFRPRLRVKFRLHDGRMLNADRQILLPDNGWTGHVATLDVIEVPGNHDSMVLEPNVRVLAPALRRVLSRCDR